MKRLTAWTVVIAGAWLATACKKEKSQGVIEPAPGSTMAAPADSATNLPREPNLEQVQQASPPPAATVSAPVGEFTKTGHYVVQVSVYKRKRQAHRLAAKLQDAGYPSYVADVENPTPDLSGTYYRVRIGNFASLRAAYDFGKNTLQPAGYAFWVDKKKNDHRTLNSGETPAAEAPVATPAVSAPPSAEPETAPVESPSSSTPASAPVAAPESATAPATATATAPASEPVGVPEPPAPSEPATPQENNSWGNPVTDSTPAPGATNSAVPATPKDTGGAVEGW